MTNFVPLLHRMQQVGALSLSSFKGLILEEDIKNCKKWKKKVPTWYSLTINTFISFLYRVSMSSILLFYLFFIPLHLNYLWYMSFNFLAWSFLCFRWGLPGYKSNTPLESEIARGIWEMMEKAAKTTIKNIRSHEFEKYLAVADPGNSDEFLLEVFLPIKSFYIFYCLQMPHL